MRTTDPVLALALGAIVSHCGPHARRLLLSGRSRLTAKEICTLSRTAPEYQRHVLGRIRAGHASPLTKTAACALVYETVSFSEVISRMERALGAVRREAAYIAAQIDSGVEALDRGADRLLTLDLTLEAAEAIAAGVRRLPRIDGGSSAAGGRGEGAPDAPQNASAKLHAASALGLLAKNVRNLPLLRPEHHPTAEEQRRALDLCAEVICRARKALGSARRRWGRLDGLLRLHQSGAATRRVITHADPDGDALVSAWLAERFLFAGEPVSVLFVPRARVLGCLRPGDCMVDVGNSFDRDRLLFDHKPPAFADRHQTCATRLVWEHLLSLGRPVGHLAELVEAVHDGDSARRRQGSDAYARSRAKGLHAHVHEARRRGRGDAGLYRTVRTWLDRYDAALRPERGRHATAGRDETPQAEGTLAGRKTRPQPLLPGDGGTYALILSASADAAVHVGRFGVLGVRPGFYVYVGSAFGPGGLRSRVSRTRPA